MTLEMNEHEALVDKRVNELSRIFEKLVPDTIINWDVKFEPVFLIHSDSLYPERYNIVIQAQICGLWIDHTPKKTNERRLDGYRETVIRRAVWGILCSRIERFGVYISPRCGKHHWVN